MTAIDLGYEAEVTELEILIMKEVTDGRWLATE